MTTTDDRWLVLDEHGRPVGVHKTQAGAREHAQAVYEEARNPDDAPVISTVGWADPQRESWSPDGPTDIVVTIERWGASDPPREVRER